MKKLILSILSSFLVAIAFAAPEVTNVIAQQQSDQVVINYTLTHPDNKHCQVSVEVSENGGVSYTITPSALNGDIGIVAGTAEGSNYQIVWNYDSDNVGPGENYRVKVIADDEIPAIVADEVAVLSDVEASLIQGLSETELIFSSEINPDLYQIGSILIKAPCPEFPCGIMRKVTGFSIQGNQIVVSTIQARLEDAFEQLYFNFMEPLKAADVVGSKTLVNGVTFSPDSKNPYSLNYNINWSPENFPVDIDLTGNLNFTIGTLLNIGLNRSQGLHYIKSGGYGSSTATIGFSAQSSITYNPPDFSLYEQNFSPIVFWIGLVPVWITPKIVLKAEIDAYAGATFNTSVTASTTISSGVEYINPNWIPYSTYTPSMECQVPSLSAGMNAKVVIGPSVELKLYSVAGPELFVGGYLDLNANPSQTPWWTLEGGVKSIIEVKFDALGYQVGFPPATLFDYHTVILQAEEAMGALSGQVKNAMNNQGLSGVNIKVYNASDNQIADGFSNSQGYYEFEVLAGSGFRVEFIKLGFHTVTYYNVNILSNQETNLQTIMQIDETYDGTGPISGFIYNALNGTPVGSVSLAFRSGLNNHNGVVADTAISGTSGYYSISTLSTGNYTVEAYRSGYVTTYFSVIVVGGQTVSGQNGVITPDLNATEVRIVLSWGQTPSDLDSHITGPNLADGRFHVYYANRNFYYNNELYCNLDVDDTSSYGPETVTIYHQTDGMYRYSIHDYSNRNSTASYAMSNSGATVRVYFGSELEETFFVPSNTIGTLWTVFEMVNGQIYPVDAMTNVSNPGSVTKGGDDLYLFKDLPEK